MQPIPVSEYRQMAGRAGRPRLDPYGEAVLIAKEAEQVPELFACYIDAAAEDVTSRLAEPTALYTHVLSLVASGFATNRSELSAFMNRSYYVHEHRQGRLMHRAVDAALEFLISAEMILELGEHLGATELGTLVSRMYIDPRSASMIVTALRERDNYTDIGLLQLICATPDMPTLYAKNSDLPALSRMIEQKGCDLWLPLPADDEEEEDYYRAIKTAMLLSDWTDELAEEKICERYAVGPGDVYGMVENINWLLHATARLAKMFAPEFYPLVADYEICMKNGIRRELLPLVRIRGIGRVRARRLFNNGITSPDEIVRCKKEDLIKILGIAITEQILGQLLPNRKETEKKMQTGDGDRNSGQSTLLRFG
jgi:helicase